MGDGAWCGTQRHGGGGGGVGADARAWSDDAWRHSRGEVSLRLAGLLLRQCALSLAHRFDLACTMCINNYEQMKINAAIDAMLKLRLQNGYRADEQQRSTTRPPSLYILHLLSTRDDLILTLNTFHYIFRLVYSCCAVSLLHANRCCHSQCYLFLFLIRNQQC